MAQINFFKEFEKIDLLAAYSYKRAVASLKALLAVRG